VELDSSYTGNADGSGTLHVSQLPPNPAVIAPGPAYIFVVVNGVPSVGVQVMCGSGTIGKQNLLSVATLPEASFVTNVDGSNSVNSGNNTTAANGIKNGAFSRRGTPTALVLVGILNVFFPWLF